MIELESLRRKYEAILELRVAHAKREEPAQKEAIRALAKEFPGALRDLDALPIAEIHDRIEAIVAAELDPENMKRWMIAELAFYEAMRGALVAKKWLGKNRQIDDALKKAFADAHAQMDASSWAHELENIARPPKGRLVTLAIARVATLLEIAPDDAKSLVFRYATKKKSMATSSASPRKPKGTAQ